MSIAQSSVKMAKVLYNECKVRGFYYSFIMYSSNFFALLRALFYKLLFFKNIRGSLYFLGKGSRIDIFSKKSKLIINKFVFIRKNATLRLDHDCKLQIEDKVFINDGCNINCVNRIHIGAYTKIGQNVCIYDHDHNYRHDNSDRLIVGEVMIGNNVWIGSNVVILRNTKIGNNAVIAAGSVVKGEVPENAVYFDKRMKEIKVYQ